MIRKIQYIFILFLSFVMMLTYKTYGQGDDLKLILKNCEVKGDSVFKLDNSQFGFTCDYNFSDNDTVWIKFIHYQGTAPINSTTFSCTKMHPSVLIHYSCFLKAGDGLMFNCYTKSKKYPTRDFKIVSTSFSLDFPYYDDIYFVYNNDTIRSDDFEFLCSYDSVDSHIIHIDSTLVTERNSKFVRIFYRDLSSTPASIAVRFYGHAFAFDFAWRSNRIYHGKIILEFHDRKDLLEYQPYEKSLCMDDKDCQGSQGGCQRQYEYMNKREMKRLHNSLKQGKNQSRLN